MVDSLSYLNNLLIKASKLSKLYAILISKYWVPTRMLNTILFAACLPYRTNLFSVSSCHCLSVGSASSGRERHDHLKDQPVVFFSKSFRYNWMSISDIH